MVLCLQTLPQERLEDRCVGVLGEVFVGRLEGLDWGCIEDELLELECGDEDGGVKGVAEPARVDCGRGEGVGVGDLDGPAGERVHKRDVEAAGVVVEVFEDGGGGGGEAGEEGGELGLVAGEEGGVSGGVEGGICGRGEEGGGEVADLWEGQEGYCGAWLTGPGPGAGGKVLGF